MSRFKEFSFQALYRLLPPKKSHILHYLFFANFITMKRLKIIYQLYETQLNLLTCS